MTDLSSEQSSDRGDMANMAGELIQAKMDSARKETQQTHVLHMGPFHMEIVPSKDIDIEKIFKAVMDDLYKKYGDKLIPADEPQQRHYG
jgi:hypothetical protein